MEGNFFSQNTLRTHQSFHHFLFGLLLWEQHLPSWVDMFLRVISELQIISILIQYPLSQFSIDDIDFFSSIFKEFSHYISLNVEFQLSGGDLVSRFTLGIFSAYLLIIVALTLYLLFMYYLKPNREPALTRLWTQMSIIHYNVIFLMIQSFVLSLIKETSDDSTSGTGKQDIWSEGLILSIGIAIMAINLAFGLITAKYAFHPMKSDYLVASRSSNFAFIGLLFKFIQTLTTSLLSDSLYKKWVSLILSILFVFIRMVQYMREFAFFHYGPTQTFFALICVQATQVILNLIWTCVGFGRDITFNMVIYSHVIFAFIAIWISRAYIRHVVWKYAVKENKKIKTEGEFFKKLFAIDKILSTGSLKHQIISKTSKNHYELLFMELVSRHGETCKIPACACKLILINKTLEQGGLKDTKFQGFELDRFYYDYIHEFFKENMRYVGANIFLSLQLAYLIIMNNENAFAHAIYIINSLKIPSRHVTLQILKAKVLQKVEAAVKSSFFSNDSGTSMKQIVDYQIAKQYLRDRLAANTKLYIDFWDQYKVSKPQIGKFLSLNRLINIDSENIDKIWESLIKNYARLCYKDYVLYGVYMRTIRSAPFTSEKLFSKYFSLVSRNLQTQGHTDKAEGFFLEEENIMICVSLNPSNFGKVTYASQNIEQLGYTSNELILKGLDTLMPPFYAKHYRNFLLHQITDDEVSVMNKNLDVFICSSSGHVQPATAYAIPFPYMQTGFYSLISLKPTQNKGERYLFVVASGRIEGMSSNLAEELNFEFAPGTVYFLDQICVDSLKVFKCMNHMHVADRRTSTFSKHDERSEEFSASAHDLLKDSGILPLLRKATLPAIAALKAKMRKQNPLTKKLQKAAEEEIDQKIAEELNSGVVKLRFEEFAMKDTSQTERSQFVFNSVISKISYHTDHLYILKLTEVEIENEHGSGLESSQRRRKASTDHSHHHLSKIKDEDTYEEVSLKDKLDHIDEKSEADAVLGEESLAMAIPIKKVNSNPSGGLGGLAVMKQAVGNLSPLGKRLKISFASYIRVERIKKVFKPKKPKTQKNSILDGAHLKEAVKRYIQTQRFELNNGGNDDESTSVKSSTRGLTSMAKTEKAIHHQGQGASYKLVKSSVIGFILTSIAVFLYYQFQGGDSFNSLTDNVDVLSLTITRLFLGVEIDRRATIIRLIGSGLMDKVRNGSPDFSQTLIENFGSVAANFSQSNNDLRESLSQFNDEQKAIFYDPLRVYQVDGTNINYENSFDLCSQLTSSCFRLYSALPNTPAPDNFDLSFILNNTLGDFLTNTDSLFGLLTAEDTNIITGMKNLLMVLLIIMIVGGILVVGVLIYGEVKFSKKKLMFFDYFLKISERDVDVILVRSRKLHELLSDNNQSEPSIMRQMQDVELSLKEPKHAKLEVKNMRNIKRKKADFKNLNKDAVIGVFSLILFIACFWIMYGVMYLFFINNQTTVQSKKQQIIDTNLYLVAMSQSITTLYLYIGVEDPSTILIYDEPLPSAWAGNYDYLISSNSFFGNIEGGDYGKYTGEINALISGDLCQLIQNGDPVCYIDGDGAKKQGIVGLDNYIMTNLKTLKDSYDISNQTVASKQAAFNNSIYSELERAYFDTLVPAYQELIAIFNTMFLETLDEFQNNILMINMIALVIFLVFGKVYWITGLRRMEVEKMYFKQIMRVIPVNIILQDKFLYSYMINNSKEMMNNWS